MRFYRCFLLLGLIFAGACNEKKKKENPPVKDNYIVLLDLSNRILADNHQQALSDITVIKSIYGIFNAKLEAKDSTHQFYNLNDKLKLLAAPNWFYASIDLSAEEPGKRALIAKKTEDSFNELLMGVYKNAVTDNSRYAGSDIRVYFDKYLANDLDKAANNTLFIITDGYMNPGAAKEQPAQNNHYGSPAAVIDALKNQADWESAFTKGDYGLFPVEKKFDNLRVMVVGLEPRPGWNDEHNLLVKIWTKWLTEMGISNYNFIRNSNSQDMIASLDKLTGTAPANSIGPEKQLTIASNDSAALASKLPLKNADSAKTIPVEDNPSKNIVRPEPAAEKTNTSSSKTANVKTAPVANPETPGAALTSSERARTRKAATPDVLPPDESDAGLLNLKKTATEKKTASKDDGDILQDNGAANGFNTGIKKKTKKKDQ